MLFFKNILIVFIMIIGTAQAEDDWEHFDCELEKLTHLLDGGVYEDKNNTLLSGFDNEISNLTVSLRFNQKEIRVHKLLGSKSYIVTEESSKSVRKDKLKETGKIATNKIIGWYDSAKDYIGWNDKKEAEGTDSVGAVPNIVNYKWAVDTDPDALGRVRTLELKFSKKLLNATTEAPEIENMKLFYSLHIPKEESDLRGVEVKKYRYECNI